VLNQSRGGEGRRIMHHAMRNRELELRKTAGQARHAAPLGLHDRTLAALGSSAGSHQRKLPVARTRIVLAAAASIGMVIAGLITIQKLGQPAQRRLSQPAFALRVPQLEGSSARNLINVSLSKPLLREAKLLVRDAQRTAIGFRNQWPKLPPIQRNHDSSGGRGARLD
jgi:hypothetical protein